MLMSTPHGLLSYLILLVPVHHLPNGHALQDGLCTSELESKQIPPAIRSRHSLVTYAVVELLICTFDKASLRVASLFTGEFSLPRGEDGFSTYGLLEH